MVSLALTLTCSPPRRCVAAAAWLGVGLGLELGLGLGLGLGFGLGLGVGFTSGCAHEKLWVRKRCDETMTDACVCSRLPG